MIEAVAVATLLPRNGEANGPRTCTYLRLRAGLGPYDPDRGLHSVLTRPHGVLMKFMIRVSEFLGIRKLRLDRSDG